LTTERDEVTARREYEYDARKKLYEAYEPLLFQFNELSENALRRVIAIARESRRGKLEENKGWLSTSGYYLDSTMYRLLIPLATFNLMQKKLTMFDLKLNPFFHQQYLLAKLLYHTFAHDIRIASIEPEIKNYDPNLILKEDSNFRKQGIFIGIIDNIADVLVIKDESRVMTFGEFSKCMSNNSERKYFQPVVEILTNFRPRHAPVLWRILMAQAFIYRSILVNYEKHYEKENVNLKEILLSIPSNWRSKFDWRQEIDRNSIPDKLVLEDPFDAVETYLHERVRELKIN